MLRVVPVFTFEEVDRLLPWFTEAYQEAIATERPMRRLGHPSGNANTTAA